MRRELRRELRRDDADAIRHNSSRPGRKGIFSLAHTPLAQPRCTTASVLRLGVGVNS